MLGKLWEHEIRFLAEIKKVHPHPFRRDRRLVLVMIRKMATLIPPQAVKKLPDLHSAECRTKIVTTGAPEGAFVDADMVRGCR